MRAAGVGCGVVAAVVAGVAALLVALSVRPLRPGEPGCRPPWVRLVYNPSDSVARGWYRIGRVGALHVGSVVLAWLPPAAAALAAQRRYLPGDVPLLKRIGAVAPQAVCVARGAVRIDGAVVAALRQVDGRGRALHGWGQCRRLRPGEIFLLSNTSADSFDSRYFGPIEVSRVIGSAQPLWVWGQR